MLAGHAASVATAAANSAASSVAQATRSPPSKSGIPAEVKAALGRCSKAIERDMRKYAKSSQRTHRRRADTVLLGSKEASGSLTYPRDLRPYKPAQQKEIELDEEWSRYFPMPTFPSFLPPTSILLPRSLSSGLPRWSCICNAARTYHTSFSSLTQTCNVTRPSSLRPNAFPRLDAAGAFFAEPLVSPSSVLVAGALDGSTKAWHPVCASCRLHSSFHRST